VAALHAAFWEERQWAHPHLGLCSLRQRYSVLALATLRRPDMQARVVPRRAVESWDLLEEAVAPGVAAVVRALLDDPSSLCAGLRAYPQTVVHGDWKLGNLGLTNSGSDRRTVLLDWAVVGVAPPAVDLAWYLAVNAARLPVTREATIETFVRGLRDAVGERFAHACWEPQLDLALLGAFLQLGWNKVSGALDGFPGVRARERDELRRWSERVLRGARRLEMGTAPSSPPGRRRRWPTRARR
jgi:hypothetical protein